MLVRSSYNRTVMSHACFRRYHCADHRLCGHRNIVRSCQLHVLVGHRNCCAVHRLCGHRIIVRSCQSHVLVGHRNHCAFSSLCQCEHRIVVRACWLHGSCCSSQLLCGCVALPVRSSYLCTVMSIACVHHSHHSGAGVGVYLGLVVVLPEVAIVGLCFRCSHTVELG